MSVQRLRTLIFRSAIPLPPASCAASAFLSDGSLSLANPQNAYTAWEETRKRLPSTACPAGAASVTGTPKAVASKVWAQPPKEASNIRVGINSSGSAERDRQALTVRG